VRDASKPYHWVIAVLALATAVSLVSIAATMVIGPWRVSALGMTVRTSGLDRALNVAFLCGVPLLLLRTRIVEIVRRRDRLVFYAGAVIVLGVLCFGPALRAKGAVILDPMPYRWLMAVPGFDQLRVPTRFWMLGTLCLGVAAALSFTRLVPPHGRGRSAVFLLVSAGLLLDGWTRGISMPAAPQQWPKVERRDQTRPILELPLGPEWDAAATFRSMRHRRPVVNGVSGYDPPHYAPLQFGLNSHDPAILVALGSLGAFDVVVNGAADPDGGWARYASSVGGEPVSHDGTRAVYRIPASPSQDVAVGPVVPVQSVTGTGEGWELMTDGKLDTEWHDNPNQRPGHWVRLYLGGIHEVGGVTQSLGEFSRDYPRRLAIEVSVDGIGWERVWEGPTAAMAFLASVRGPRECAMRFTFPARPARFVRLRALEADKNLWRIAELLVHAPLRP
jgi:hypothetical protein